MNKLIRFLFLFSIFAQVGCLYDTYESLPLKQFKSIYGNEKGIGQARFAMDDMGTLTLKGLMDVRIMPIKVYETALLLAHENEVPLSSKSVPQVMEKYGFIRTSKIANWNGRGDAQPKPEVMGYISTYIEKELAPTISLKIQVGTITCAACHSGRVYTSDGKPTNQVWLGGSNSSINFDLYLNKIYQGLKIAAKDTDGFLEKIKIAFPEMDQKEENSIKKFILPKIKDEIEKMAAMDRVLPFDNGGPGLTNGLSAFKRASRLHDNAYKFQSEEKGFVSVPDINYRQFRSSLLVDGSYGTIDLERNREIKSEEANSPTHLKNLAQLAAFFTYSAMGNTLQNVEGIIPNVEEIFNDFLASSVPQRFPGEIDWAMAEEGHTIYTQSCSKCHGVFEGKLNDLKLVSFPNKFVPYEKIGTDNYRWSSLDSKIKNYANSNKLITRYVAKFDDQKGYVAPILSGLWATAPYLHNGSVPDLKSFLNPELRPEKFKVGGHALDLKTVGIAYPDGYRPFSIPMEFDTTQKGRSNAGHVNQLKDLSRSQKEQLLEYLKLL